MGIDEEDIDPAQFLEDVEMRVGEVVSVEDFPGRRARTSTNWRWTSVRRSASRPPD